MVSFIIALKRLLKALWEVVNLPIAKGLLTTLLIIIFGGTIFLHTEGGLPLIDALFTSIVVLIPTSLSVEYMPDSVFEKLFMLVYLLTGSGVMISVLVVVTSTFVKKNYKRN
ncbi:hypothetical protein [Staphylococcus rostri]|uniref:Uncharacterized protein n=1 Tax=Staphylococcus rostri TaxID=522262 RepID=A0A2K3YUV3_9STAP|nr:hypothetical protein [Staphylococcus rostri]PNZ29357.1 hypothetical protein CD122_02400 [Staphylococcus rostri]